MSLDELTLMDIERIAARLEAATRTFHEARALLGGAAGASPAQPPAQTPAAVASPLLTPDELAQREALLSRNRIEDLPAELQRAERQTRPA